MTLLDEKKYTPTEAAEKLGISRDTFDSYVGTGAIAVIRHSQRHIEIPESSLEAYLQKKLKESQKAPRAKKAAKKSAKKGVK